MMYSKNQESTVALPVYPSIHLLLLAWVVCYASCYGSNWWTIPDRPNVFDRASKRLEYSPYYDIGLRLFIWFLRMRMFLAEVE